MTVKRYGLPIALLVGAMITLAWLPVSARADITDFNEWTLVEDPAHDKLTSSVDSSSQITLSATGGPISKGFDIGYQSVNGPDVSSSTQGWAFDPLSNFSIAVDYNLAFGSPSGGFSIGMGIGEDRDGTDSAGVVLTSLSGGLLAFGGAARVNDGNQAPLVLGAGQLTGRFLVSYDAASGNVTVGASTNGDDTPEVSGTFTGIQNAWDDEVLLASFFARGDNGLVGWNSGTADAIFTNFRVTDGSAVAVPEPSAFLLSLLSILSVGALVWRQRTQS